MNRGTVEETGPPMVTWVAISSILFGRIYIPGIELVLPKRIEEIAVQVTLGGPVSSTIPLFTIGLQIALFTLVALWRFKREEF